jgi:predicted type IV restriction endonuclease
VLIDSIERIQRDLRAGRFANEAAVSQGVLLPLLHELGWPVFDTRVVAPEYALEGRRVDYALCDRSERPIAFVEAKRVGSVAPVGARRTSARSVQVPPAVSRPSRRANCT